MRFKIPLRGIHIGPKCVDGTDYGKTRVANGRYYAIGSHTHHSGPYTGYICATSPEVLQELLTHEIAHLATDHGHDDRWRRQVARLGGRVTEAYRKQPK